MLQSPHNDINCLVGMCGRHPKPTVPMLQAAPLQYAGEAKATQLLKFLRSNAEHWFSLDGEEFTFLRRLKSVVSAREAIKAAFRERRELLVEITRLKEELGIYHKKKQGI